MLELLLTITLFCRVLSRMIEGSKNHEWLVAERNYHFLHHLLISSYSVHLQGGHLR